MDVQCLASQAPDTDDTRTLWSYGLFGTNTMNRLQVTRTHIIHDLGGDANSATLASIYDLCDGEYHELMVTSSASDRKIFMDGGLLATKATPGNQAATDENFCLGGEDNSDNARINRAWVGYLSDFRSTPATTRPRPSASAPADGHHGLHQRPLGGRRGRSEYEAGTQFTFRPTGCRPARASRPCRPTWHGATAAWSCTPPASARMPRRRRRPQLRGCPTRTRPAQDLLPDGGRRTRAP